jgi:hypothetical protein
MSKCCHSYFYVVIGQKVGPCEFWTGPPFERFLIPKRKLGLKIFDKSSHLSLSLSVLQKAMLDTKADFVVYIDPWSTPCSAQLILKIYHSINVKQEARS